MGVTNDFGQKAFNRQGSAIVEVYDSSLTAYRYMGRVTGVSYTPETSKIQQRAPVHGISRITQERTTAIEGMLSFSLMEQMAPDVAQLLFGDPSIDQTLTAAAVASDKQVKTLYNTDVQFATNEHGLVNGSNLGTVSAGTPVAAGSGALAGAYYFWVSAVYGDTTGLVAGGGATLWSGTPTGNDGIDIKFAEGAVMSSSVTVTASGEATIEVGTLATTGPTPDNWVVWVNTSDAIAGAELFAMVAGSVATTGPVAWVPDTSGNNVAYEAGVGIGVQSIAAYSTGTPTYDKHVSGTDFTYDSTQGTIKRIAAGDINHGEDVRVTTWNFNPEYITTGIGAPVSNQDTRQVRVTSFEGEVDKTATDPLETPDFTMTEPRLAEGERFVFYRVNFSGTQPNYSYTEEDFHDGANVEVNCQYDGTQAKIGDHQGWSRKFANFVQNYA